MKSFGNNYLLKKVCHFYSQVCPLKFPREEKYIDSSIVWSNYLFPLTI